MADQTNKQLNLVDRMANTAEQFDALLTEMEQQQAEYAQAGTLEQATLDSSASLMHIEVADVTNLVTRWGQATDWINASYRRDVLRKVRK